MDLNTAASVMSYVGRLEEESAKFYEEAAAKHETLREPFLAFAKENRKHEKNVKRAYYSVISDALETGFSFKGLQGDVDLPQSADVTANEAIRLSLDMEAQIKDFYEKAAKISGPLMADVPRAMEQVVKKRGKRIEQLNSLRRQADG
jgi:rubrerythrin